MGDDVLGGGDHFGQPLDTVHKNAEDALFADLFNVEEHEPDSKLEAVLAASDLKDRLATMGAAAPPPAGTLSVEAQNLQKVSGNNRWG